ncbi:glucose dehydrogenase [FAD, quinone]-like [Spodoptera litura]|uniref:Glucose dehydrogenase [FAD, quinone]-like n=1 Tax=Spodoptera litura TaxID=69820 RepID=A0A9J7J321_SPOLT|nr:glucose dehydrogenase [FAD, quinone]-like [Spodoptera litura]
MLEAGDVQTYDSFLPGTVVYLPKTDGAWNYLAQPDGYTDRCHKQRAMFTPIGKMLGGSSSVNFMIASRGVKHDYDMWATAANDSSWQYKNLVKYLNRSVRHVGSISMYPQVNMELGDGPYMGEEGNIGISQDYSTVLDDYVESFKELGNKIVKYLGGEHSKGYARGLLTIAEGYRQSTAFTYLSPVRNNSNLFVSRRTVVNKIVFNRRKNAIGVRVSIDGGEEIFLRAKKEVIVSAGAIKSPQLLMLSGIGPRNHLREKNITVVSDLPVGENFQDQQVVTVLHAARKIKDPGAFNYHLYPSSFMLGFRSLKLCSETPDYATYNFIQERLEFILQYCGLPYDFQNDICDRSYRQVLGRQNTYTQIINLYPKSRGKVTLNTTNADDAPLIETGYFTEEEDINNMVEYVKDFLPLVNTTYFKEVNGRIVDPVGDKCSMHEYGSDDYWKCYVYCMATSMWNFGGTCAMGSVVDSKLKVYGVQRLRVVDASVMPTVVAGGSYLATVMIAEKASDMINADHRSD